MPLIYSDIKIEIIPVQRKHINPETECLYLDHIFELTQWLVKGFWKESGNEGQSFDLKKTKQNSENEVKH